MDYNLAKKLKEAGFPQKEAQSWEDIEGASPWENYMNTRNLEGRHGTFDSSIAGYKEIEPDFFEQGKCRPSARFKREYLDSEEGKRFTVYFPTLSELIKECGDELKILEQEYAGSGNVWVARPKGRFWCTSGSIPEIAVANLWLELNKKP